MEEILEKVRKTAIKAKDEAARLTKQVADKTNNVISQTKVSYALSENEKRIKEIYAEIGKKVYESYKQTGEADNFLENCEKLDILFEESQTLNKMLSELKDSVKCSVCGEYNKKAASYCARCGASLYDAKKSDKTDIEDVIDEVKEKASDVVEDFYDAVEKAENAVKKAVTIKAKKPEDKE